MRPTAWRLCAVVLAFWPAVAEAHSPIKGLGTFYNYMLHPLVVPAHALLLAAVALMLGQQGGEAAGRGLIAFALGLACGLLISGAGVVAGVREPMLLAGSLVVGGVVSLGNRLPRLITLGIAGIVGIAIGLDPAPEASAMREAILAYAGLVSGILFLATVASGLTVNAAKQWQRIGVRIAGSWIVAISVLVLALALAGPAKHDAATLLASGKARQC
jgi:urease accessory protein